MQKQWGLTLFQCRFRARAGAAVRRLDERGQAIVNSFRVGGLPRGRAIAARASLRRIPAVYTKRRMGMTRASAENLHLNAGLCRL
jgi:hypothetical protein